MSFILRVGASNLPIAGDTIAVYETGTTNLISGLKTPDTTGSPLPNPFTVPASGQYGFEPPNTDRVDIYWITQAQNIVTDVNVRDITLDLKDGAFKQFRFNAINGEASTIPSRSVIIINPGDNNAYRMVSETVGLQAGFTDGDTLTGASTSIIGGVGHILDGFTGLTAGQFYMYSYTTPGAIEIFPLDNEPFVLANVHRVIGQALSTTELRVLNGLQVGNVSAGNTERFTHIVTSAEITDKKISFSGIGRNEPGTDTQFTAVYIGGGLINSIDFALSTGTGAEFDWNGYNLEPILAQGETITFSYTY